MLLRLSGFTLRNLATSRIVLAGLSALLAGAVVLWWTSCRNTTPVGRVVLAEPIEQYDPGYVYELPPPPPSHLKPTGTTIEVPTYQPASRKAEKELDRTYGELEQVGTIVGEVELGKLPYGGKLLMRVAPPTAGEESPVPVTTLLRPHERPWAEWEGRWWVGAGYEAVVSQGAVEGGAGVLGEVRWVPGRIGAWTPEVSGGWSEVRGAYGRVLVGRSF